MARVSPKAAGCYEQDGALGMQKAGGSIGLFVHNHISCKQTNLVPSEGFASQMDSWLFYEVLSYTVQVRAKLLHSVRPHGHRGWTCTNFAPSKPA